MRQIFEFSSRMQVTITTACKDLFILKHLQELYRNPYMYHVYDPNQNWWYALAFYMGKQYFLTSLLQNQYC